VFAKLKEDKQEEVETIFLKVQEHWSFFVTNSFLLAGKTFLFGDNPSLADFATLPFLNTQEIIMRKIFNKNLFESKDQKVQENLIILKKYIECAKEKTEFLLANQKARVLPKEEQDPVIKALGMNSEKFNFEDYLTKIIVWKKVR